MILFYFYLTPPEMLVAFKLVVKADHFGAAAEPGSFKYLREQVYFGVPAFYPVVGLNMFKCFLFFLFFSPLPCRTEIRAAHFQGFNPVAPTSG